MYWLKLTLQEGRKKYQPSFHPSLYTDSSDLCHINKQFSKHTKFKKKKKSPSKPEQNGTFIPILHVCGTRPSNLKHKLSYYLSWMHYIEIIPNYLSTHFFLLANYSFNFHKAPSCLWLTQPKRPYLLNWQATLTVDTTRATKTKRTLISNYSRQTLNSTICLKFIWE